MERPENIIKLEDYDKPHSFERDWDAEIFYSYIDAQKYIDYLESEVKKLRLGVVVGQSEQLKCSGCKKTLNDGLCGSCCSDLASGNY